MVSDVLDVAALEPGTELMDKYRVVETLGIGGMGVVVACDHLSLGHRVAIKFLLPKYVSNEEVVRRFLQEARAAIKIDSDHVAQVIDVGLLKDDRLPAMPIPFMVMEYLEGKDLSQWVQLGKRFSVPEAIDHTVQAAAALAHAHRVGIIHRDVKPANLFLAEQKKRNVVKVLDFGISKSLDEDPKDMGLTKTTTVLGSGLYMSPEQMRSAKDVDFRTDIYSLGVCLYELLTGTQPYTAETFSELCVKVNIEPPTPLETYRSDLPDGFAEVVGRAYARDPSERYQTIQDFVGALASFAAAPSLPGIDLVQGITENRESLTSQPKLLDRTSASGALATAADRDEPARRSIGVVLTTAVGALMLAAGIGQFVLQAREGRAGPGAAQSAAAGPATKPPLDPSVSVGTSASAAPSVDGPEAGSSASTSTSAAPAGSNAPKAPPAASSTSAKTNTCVRLDPRTGSVATLPCD